MLDSGCFSGKTLADFLLKIFIYVIKGGVIEGDIDKPIGRKEKTEKERERKGETEREKERERVRERSCIHCFTFPMDKPAGAG